MQWLQEDQLPVTWTFFFFFFGRDHAEITFLSKICLIKALVFLVVMYRCENWTIKKAEDQILMLLNCGAGEDS